MRLRVFTLTITIVAGSLACHAARQNMDKMLAQWSSTPSQTLLDKGREAVNSGKLREAMVLYSTVANRYYQEGAAQEEYEQAARAMNNIGYIYFYCYYDYQKAFAYLHQAQFISEKYNFELNLAYINLNLANLYLVLAEMQPSEKYFASKPLLCYRKAFNYAVKSKKWDVLQAIYTNLLVYAYSADCMPAIKKEREVYGKLHFPNHTVLVKYNRYIEQAITSCMKRQYKEALNLVAKARQAIDTPDTPERYLFSVIGMEIHIYEQLHNTDSLKLKFREMNALVNKYDIKDAKADYYKMMFEYYSKNGIKDSASHYEILFIKAKDALITESRLQAAGEMHFLSELQTANDKVKILAAQQRQQRIIILLCCILIAVLILSAIYFVRKNKELRSKQQALFERIQESLRREELQKQQTLQQLQTAQKQVKYQNSKLSDNIKKEIYDKILSAMNDVELICQSDFSLRILAEHIDKPYAEVSQVINEMTGKNFNALLGELRVKEACRRLSDINQYGHLTIEAISASVGFKSRTNFVAIFKKVTGLTPSEYQRSARLQNDIKKV